MPRCRAAAESEPASATAGALSAPASAAPDAPRRPPRFDEVEDDAELPEEFLPAPRRLEPLLAVLPALAREVVQLHPEGETHVGQDLLDLFE